MQNSHYTIFLRRTASYPFLDRFEYRYTDCSGLFGLPDHLTRLKTIVPCLSKCAHEDSNKRSRSRQTSHRKHLSCDTIQRCEGTFTSRSGPTLRPPSILRSTTVFLTIQEPCRSVAPSALGAISLNWKSVCLCSSGVQRVKEAASL